MDSAQPPPRFPAKTSDPLNHRNPGPCDGRYAAGIINYRTYDDLERCLDSLKSQSLQPAEVIVVDGEVFDEDFFVYHEDTDLCWRANRLGWRSLYVPSARAIHSRRWQKVRRFQMDPVVRRHSFKNHYLQIIKNERARDFLVNLPILAVWELARLGFAVLADRDILSAYADARQLSRRAWKKRRILKAKLREPRSTHRARASVGGPLRRFGPPC